MVQDKAWGRLALPAVAVGVAAVSAAAVMVRLTDAPAIAIAFWRCALGVLVLLPVAVLRRERPPSRQALRTTTVSGIALGAHFGFWIASLDYTSVAASAVLVSTTPVFVAILAYLFLGERTSLVSFLGILVAIAGTVVIAGGGASYGESVSLGNALAVVGAIMMAVYVLTGRSLRTEGMSALTYSIYVYLVAALGLLAAGLVSGTQMWGYSGETWLWLGAITLGPQILGHTVFNWALGHVNASIVSGTILAEPVVAALLAWLVLAEKPGLATVIGGAVVLAGLYFLLRGYRPGQGEERPVEPVP